MTIKEKKTGNIGTGEHSPYVGTGEHRFGEDRYRGTYTLLVTQSYGLIAGPAPGTGEHRHAPLAMTL